MSSQSFTPEAFGKYFLVDKIATGGMAEIFKAKTYSHGGFENLLVIKRILPHIGENQEFVSMFVDEAKISVALQHPNIVRVYDFGKILENYFIAMECVDGKDIRNILRKLSRRKDTMPERFAAYVAQEVCKGLHYAHVKADNQGQSFGIVHRDISPSNVLLSYEGEVKVADFGIAKADKNAYQTKDGMLKGKFEYMSPEQAQGQDIDLRSDVFSVGIILYEMMTMRRLFKTESELATLKKIKDGELVHPRVLKPELSPRLEDICLKALANDPENRYQSAQDMADDLRGYLFPETPDMLRRELQAWMHGVFEEDIAEERLRLESGNAIALQLKDQLPMSWDGSAELTMTRAAATTAVRVVVPWIAAMGLGMLLMFGVALFGVFWVIVYHGRSTVPDGPAGIDVMVSPSARVSVDGTPKGEGTSVHLEGYAPGDYMVHLEADGYRPFDQPITVVAGQFAKLATKLEPVDAVAPGTPNADPQPGRDPAPAVPAGPPRVDFRSVPNGATVLVDGKDIGKAPVSWGDAEVGKAYAVEMRLDGFTAARSTLRDVRKGPQKFGLTLEAVAAPASLSVVLVGGGWANVYVDGNKLAKTAPLKEFPVPPGKHEVRVENPTLGLDTTETQTFAPGQVTTMKVKTQ